jgi:hypothetical protein
MTDIFRLNTDQTILGHDGSIAANGQVHFYDRKTGEYAPVYGDAALSVSLRQPVQADVSGVLPPIYLDDAIAYRAVITDRKNSSIREIENVRRHREGIKVLGGVDALKRFCGPDPFVLVTTKGGCPVFYKRLTGCDLPAEQPPEVIHADCCPDCDTAWQICRSEPDICAMDPAELNCDYHVLVQECPREIKPDGSVKPGGSADPCHCDDESEAAPPVVKKASIGALLSAAGRCLPRTCIPHDAPELALDPNGALIAGDREPSDPESSELNGSFGECLQVFLDKDPDQVARHLQLDSGVVRDLLGAVPRAPEITLTNTGRCRRQYEIRALNRLNRAVDPDPKNWATSVFQGAPQLGANLQTRLGRKSDPLLNAPFGVADWKNNLPWLTWLSIADSTMGPFMTGHLGDANTANFNKHASANAYTENTLLVILNPGVTETFAVKYHIYWDQYASPAQLAAVERVHYGTRIIARRVR